MKALFHLPRFLKMAIDKFWQWENVNHLHLRNIRLCLWILLVLSPLIFHRLYLLLFHEPWDGIELWSLFAFFNIGYCVSRGSTLVAFFSACFFLMTRNTILDGLAEIPVKYVWGVFRALQWCIWIEPVHNLNVNAPPRSSGWTAEQNLYIAYSFIIFLQL